MIIGNTKLEIIQGDTFVKTITIGGITDSSKIIKNIYFSCAELNISRKLNNPETNVYELLIHSEETNEMKEFYGTYDLTIEFVDEKINTFIYNSQIVIKPKKNKVIYE